MHVERPNHEPLLLMLNTGHMFPGHPSMGAWLTYGLATDNQNLPGYVNLCPRTAGDRSPAVVECLPGIHQGVHLPNNESEPEKFI